MVPHSDHNLNLIPVPKLSIKSSIFKPKVYMDKAYLYQKYVAEELNLCQLAAISFTCRSTVRRHLEKFGIPIRSHVNQRKMQVHKKYGFHKRNGLSVKKHTEQRVINAIFEMRREGMSLRAIARTLDQMKIPTKTKGKGWQYEMVRQILIKHNLRKSPSNLTVI